MLPMRPTSVTLAVWLTRHKWQMVKVNNYNPWYIQVGNIQQSYKDWDQTDSFQIFKMISEKRRGQISTTSIQKRKKAQG